MLKIIDFWERRDYAVKEEHKEENKEEQAAEQRQKIGRKEAVGIAKNTLHEAYGLDMDSAVCSVEFNSAKLPDGSLSSYFVYLSKDSWDYDAYVEVDSKNGAVNQVNISHKEKEECVSGIKVTEGKYRKYSEQIYNLLSAVGVKSDGVEEIRLIYKYYKDGRLSRGNIKYLVKLEDGTGYVFLYSANTNRFYNFYKIYRYAYTLKREKKKAKIQRQNGILVKNKVIMK